MYYLALLTKRGEIYMYVVALEVDDSVCRQYLSFRSY